MQERVAVILGPTATGKSKVGIALAKKLQGEIISGDSMLVYRRMNIGTAKPSEKELQSVPHHLINILEPDERYNVYRFQQQAARLIAEINGRGHLPIIVGGTGLYIQALLEKYEFSEDGKTTVKHPGQYDAKIFGLKMERSFLYERINQRVDTMLEQGLKEEVEKLLAEGISPDCQSMKSIGYRQMLWYLQDGMHWDEMVDKLKQATRNFAKRQFTWYRHMDYIDWYCLDRKPDYDFVVKDIMKKLAIDYKMN